MSRAGAATDDALRSALEDALGRHFAASCRVRRLARRPSDYSTSFMLEELEVEVDGPSDGPRDVRVLFKDLGRESLLPDARDVRPAFLYTPRREIGVYEHVLSGRGLGTATCYGSVADDRSGRYWLFLEHVAGAKLCHVGDFVVWAEAARWLARLHAALAGAADADAGAPWPPTGVPLLRYDADWYRRWLDRGRVCLADPGARRTFDRIAARYDTVVDRLTSLGQTFIHGEFYAGNVLAVPPAPAGSGAAWRICPVDWEMAAVGPGLFDVAALTAGDWTDDQRSALVDAYRAALAARGVAVGPADEMRESLDYCRLQQAVQWVGWAADAAGGWVAPHDQSRDWLREAVALADRLGL